MLAKVNTTNAQLGETLPATVETITQAVFEQTRSRALQREFVMAYNNVNVRGYNGLLAGWDVFASPFVIDGPNGLRANGFEVVLLKREQLDCGLAVTCCVRRDRNVKVEG